MIRRLRPADAPGYRALRIAALAAEPAAFAADAAEEGALPDDWFAGTLAAHAVFGWEEGRALLGLAGLTAEAGRKRRHIGHLWGLYVSPAARGRGVGRALVAAVLDEARARGLGQVQLGVATGNAPALALYRAMGFAVFGTERDALRVADLALDEHLMALHLGPSG